MLGVGPIPHRAAEIALGIPCDLVRRRPDVRRAERLAAAQGEQIGIAEAALYPTFTINGTLNYTAAKFSDLFSPNAFNGSVGPSFRWDLLNYGRILNNVRFQEATFRELVVTYQQTVLTANEEVENGLDHLPPSAGATKVNAEGVRAGEEAVKIAILQYQQGAINFTTYATNETTPRATAGTAWPKSRGPIATGMVQTYVAAGGGWELRLQQVPGGGPSPSPMGSPVATPMPEAVQPPPAGQPVMQPPAPPAGQPAPAPTTPAAPPTQPAPAVQPAITRAGPAGPAAERAVRRGDPTAGRNAGWPARLAAAGRGGAEVARLRVIRVELASPNDARR